MDIVVTGGAGFIGSNLVRTLVARGDRVRVLDDLSTGDPQRLADVPSAELVVGDVRDAALVRETIDGADVVFHLAALPSVSRSVSDPVGTEEVNVRGTRNVLVAALDADVSRVVYASSSSVYGDTPTLPKHEEMAPTPRSPYAAYKLAGEMYCRAFAAAYGLSTVSLRFFNVFGPYQDPRSEYAAVVPRFVTRMLGGEAPVVFGDGTQSRDFTYVANVVHACLLAAGSERASGEAMNVGCGERISLLQLVDELKGLLGTEVSPVFAEPRTGDVRHSLASISRAESLLGYRPLFSVHAGLQETVAWYASRPDAQAAAASPAGLPAPGLEPASLQPQA